MDVDGKGKSRNRPNRRQIDRWVIFDFLEINFSFHDDKPVCAFFAEFSCWSLLQCSPEFNWQILRLGYLCCISKKSSLIPDFCIDWKSHFRDSILTNVWPCVLKVMILLTFVNFCFHDEIFTAPGWKSTCWLVFTDVQNRFSRLTCKIRQFLTNLLFFSDLWFHKCPRPAEDLKTYQPSR